ncbi:MAG: CHAD domain-containing protein [Anaerolineae bacterium]|nr:CHAD domain-containing protein [Anaerolineae bacterium]
MEIEAKLAIPNRDLFGKLQAITALGPYSLTDSRIKEVTDTYFDTPDRRFRKAGYALRRRVQPDGFVMTLKALEGGAGAIRRREELEITLSRELPVTEWPDSPLKQRVSTIAGDAPITPEFSLSQIRTVRMVCDRGRTIAELSIDEVHLHENDQEEVFFVLEAERIESGTEEDLQAITALLQDTWRLQPDSRSKLERAEAFFASEKPETPVGLLVQHEREVVEAIAEMDNLYGRRAKALLALDQGLTQQEAGELADMSARRVRHWLAEFRERQLNIFPDRICKQALAAPTSTTTPPQPNASEDKQTTATTTAEPANDLSETAVNDTPPPTIPLLQKNYSTDAQHFAAIYRHATDLFRHLSEEHGLPSESAQILEPACRVYSIGKALDPQNPGKAGTRVFTEANGAALSSKTGRLLPALLLFSQRRMKPERLKNLQKQHTFTVLSPEEQAEALHLAAILRMAAGLDYRESGTTEIINIRREGSTCDITVTGPFAGTDAGMANAAADLWRLQTGTRVKFHPPHRTSTQILAHLLNMPEGTVTPESIALPEAPGIQRDDTIAEAARKTFLYHFQVMLYHEPGTRLGEDIEELHDMRVATRRMRTAARVLESYLDVEALQPFIKDLRRTGRALGAVRDLDVFWEKTEQYLASLPKGEQPDLSPLRQAWKSARVLARDQMLAYLDSKRYRKFKERYGEFLQTPWLDIQPLFNHKGDVTPHLVKDITPILIMERLARMRGYDEWLREPDVPLSRYHRLRIACKQLRYTLEYFREVLGPETKDLITQIKKLQDHLGDLQDAVVASNILRDFLVWGAWRSIDDPTERPAFPEQVIVAPGVAVYLATRQVELKRQVETFLPLWETYQSHEFSKLVADVVATL